MIHIPFFIGLICKWFVTILWILLSFLSFGTQRGNSAKSHQCWIEKDYLNNSCDFSHSFMPETVLPFIFILFRLFPDIPWTISTYLSVFRIWICFACLFFQSVNIPFQRQTQKSKALFTTFNVVENWIHWVPNTYCVQFVYICFLCLACLSILLRSYFNWTCP